MGEAAKAISRKGKWNFGGGQCGRRLVGVIKAEMTVKGEGSCFQASAEFRHVPFDYSVRQGSSNKIPFLYCIQEFFCETNLQTIPNVRATVRRGERGRKKEEGPKSTLHELVRFTRWWSARALHP